ncbi:HAMP domain-containing histidine kinase [Crassaminicella thermophila]|uniref:histidine kinase n=1 Tax=Crassaminicella thermophila TaxID=2599308 RepID=A0A5C0SG45_CRATE|nr:HAMP domain-containing sensor histidine kinase [Crassaminicella thermophila]QEK13130.1 HAMP domain-containing histidine kinase [Crassaminicella thermophila]
MTKGIILILSTICMFLSLILFKQNKQIKKINKVLMQIEKGNFNQRVRLNTNNRNMEKLCETINILVNKFQKILIEYKKIEESRKKIISNISHDLRTPLTSLLGYIEAIKNDPTLREEEKEKYIEVVYSKGKLLHVLLEDFFALSKIESNDDVLNFEKINICESVRMSILTFYEDFTKNNIIPEIQLPDEQVFISGDEKSIHRILNNLLSNALKYGKDGGKIGIEIKKEKEFVRIIVWDNGKGIPNNEIPHIFERLYTLEDSRNTHLQGNGLGLTIVKKLIEKHGGKIYVSSIPYKKTEFSFTFPLVQ